MVKCVLLSWIHLEYLYKTRLYNKLELRAKKHTKRTADLHTIATLPCTWLVCCQRHPRWSKEFWPGWCSVGFCLGETFFKKKHLKRSQRPIEIAAVARIYHFFGWMCVKKTPKAAVWQNSFARVFVPEKPTLLGSRLTGYPLLEKRETNKHGSRLGEQMDGFHKDLEWTMMNPLIFSGMHMKSVLVITNLRPISG